MWGRGSFSPGTSVSPAKIIHLTNFSIIIIIIIIVIIITKPGAVTRGLATS
jgi:hypothetical protein